MKIFMCGTENINKKTLYNQLPYDVVSAIDNIIKESTDIIIGDCFGIYELVQKYLNSTGYRNVKVYVLGSKTKARHNIGNWEEKHFQIDGKRRTAYSMRIEKDFQMAHDADEGIGIWDGKSIGTFINLLNLTILGKKSRVYLLNENKWIDIKSIEDLKAYRGNRCEWTVDDIRFVLDRCGFSNEMIEHLVPFSDYGDYDISDYAKDQQDVYCYGITDIICQAPIALKEKESLFDFLMKKRNLKFNIYNNVYKSLKTEEKWKKIKKNIKDLVDWTYDDGWSYMWEARDEIRDAINMMDDYLTEYEGEGLFYLFSEWYDTDSFVEKSFGNGLFSSIKEVMNYINNEKEDDDLNDHYYRIESWKPENSKFGHYKKIHKCDYYIFDGRICWFEKMSPKAQDNGNTYYIPASRRLSSGEIDLNRSVPYRTGDIVRIDCRPFGPPFHAMILESRSLYDCCFPTIIFKVPFTDKWRMTSLKHKRFYKHAELGSYEPMLSPLYRLKKVKPEEMTEDDDILIRLSNTLEKDEEKASKIWKMWREEYDIYEDIGIETMKKIFNKLI